MWTSSHCICSVPQLQRPVEPLIPRARTYSNTKLALRDRPHSVIPDGEIIASEIKYHNLSLLLLEVDALEATQHLWWFAGASREVEVKLRNLARASEIM
jgi:hypothetical protein